MKDAQKTYKTFGKNRSLRLKSFDYSEPYRAYFLTLCTNDKITYLSDDAVCFKILSSLRFTCREEGYRLLAYCMMPDHLNVLMQAGERPKDLRAWVRDFKKYTTHICRDYIEVGCGSEVIMSTLFVRTTTS